MPTADLPGMGEMIRTSGLATAYAMFLASAVIRSTFTAGPSSTSYRVTVGPRVKPVTAASTLNSVKTLVSDATMASLAALRVLPGPPRSSRSSEGSE